MADGYGSSRCASDGELVPVEVVFMLLFVFADVKEGVGLIHALASVIVDTHSFIFAGLIHAMFCFMCDRGHTLFHLCFLIHANFMCDRGHTLGHGAGELLIGRCLTPIG